MSISEIYTICSAYESGVGHGIKDDGLCNPFEPGTDEHEAYAIGIEEGLKISQEDRPKNRKMLLIGCGSDAIEIASTLRGMKAELIIMDDLIPPEIEESVSMLGHIESFRLIPSLDHTSKTFKESNAQRCNYSTKVKRK